MPSFLSSIFGRKPDVPQLPTLTLGGEQQQAIGSNFSALKGAENLVSSANKFSRDEITQMLNAVLPGYSSMLSTATGNIQSELKGELPSDVQSLVENRAAARAVGGGYGGSGVHSALEARDLGLTSLQLTQQGLNSFENWTRTASSMYEPSQVNVSSMFINPTQEAAFDVNQQENQFQRQWMESQIEAMPDPVASGMFNLSLGVLKEVGSAVGGAAAGGGGGGGGGL